MDNQKWPKCPKCRSRNVELIEIWTAYISWIPEEPFYNEGALEPGESTRVEGHCQSCEHRWRMRGIIQVKKEWFEDVQE